VDEDGGGGRHRRSWKRGTRMEKGGEKLMINKEGEGREGKRSTTWKKEDT
jgi:hypothetical protein